MRIFYQHNLACTRIGLAGSTRALSYGRLTLAIRHSSQLYPYLVATNMLNTATAIVSPGKITPISYTPFGFAHQEQQTRVGFNGEYPDPLTGNYGLGQGYRWYSPTLKRFQAADDISPFGQGGISAYAYTHNDPVNSYDPDGHHQYKYYRNLVPIKLDHTERRPMGFFATQPKAGKRKLLVNLHGAPDGKKIYFDDKAYTSKDFFGLLNNLGIDTNNFSKIILISCNTGKAFAPEIAHAANIPVRAPGNVITGKTYFDASSNSYTSRYVQLPGPKPLPPLDEAFGEKFSFGLMKFFPIYTNAHDIRQSVKTGQ
ncbi:MAG: RHS repeat-associated core domain-containing protein [Candidatus Pseudomonas phytovorans]|uniref:RHS repeat-associated core domain-containing protein n=1 Tax=Candidatus Pseudomonas phytovorans TaxID=3121377 RepID=A0AAJ5WE03_9PSED|nr:RHS repeat-associated core domain-containing protein [Pseudomonas sp.]WEK28947.1 MAG: RHS repeat-associated core domain-containing protein [Pseudomonas sp.]